VAEPPPGEEPLEPTGGAAPVSPLEALAAGDYPFGRALESFFLGGAAADALPAGRPLLAYGANASPEALARKLPGVPVAALPGVLHGWTIVHSAHVSPYGQVPATLLRDPDGRSDAAVHVLLVDPADRGLLDATEPNYDLVTLTGLDLEVEVLGPLAVADAYLSKHGALEIDGAPVALGALPQSVLVRAVRSL
jgi:hypothetical protein